MLQQPKLQSCLVEMVENWEHRVPFEGWQKKFTDLVHKTARNSIRSEVGINILVNGVTSFIQI